MNMTTLRSDVSIKLRSILLPNKKGLVLSALEREYQGMLGENIPFRRLGYSSLLSMLKDLPDVVSISSISGGNYLIMGTADDKTKHIAEMVNKQRDNNEGKGTFQLKVVVNPLFQIPKKIFFLR